MKIKSCFLFIICLFISASIICDEPELIIQEVSDNLIVLNTGYNVSATIALNTEKGIVISDTTISLGTAERIRHYIENRFGKKVTDVINTHHHWDHTSGNQIYKDTVIIAHENTVKGMQKFAEGKETLINGLTKRLERLRANLLKPEITEAEKEETRKNLSTFETILKERQGNFTTTYPTVTFTDQFELKMDGTILQAYYYGNAHTDSDIIIYIPSENVILTGDLFGPNHNLFTYSSELDDFPVDKWLALLDMLLSKDKKVNKAISGHGIIFSREEIEARRDYIKTLFAELKDARARGLDFEQVEKELTVEKKFGFLKKLKYDPVELEKFNKDTVKFFWEKMK